MARKTIDNNLFRKTEKVEKIKKGSPLSIYVTAEEKTELDRIAAEVGENKHSLMQFAIKEFLRRYAAGEYKIESEKVVKKTITPL